MRGTCAHVTVLVLFQLLITRVTAICLLPVYLQDKWIVDNNSNLIIRQDKVILHKGNARTRFDCIANDGGLMLLKVRRLTTEKETRIVCLLIDEMADAGFTIQRLNPQEKKEDIFDPQTVSSELPLSLSGICHGNSHFRLVFIKRAPASCKIPRVLRGIWDVSAEDILSVTVNKTALVFSFQGNQTLTMTCEERLRQQFLLRTEFNKLTPKTDGYFCVKIKKTVRGPESGYAVLFAKHGTIWDKTIKLVPHKQPLLLGRDCLQDNYALKKLSFIHRL